MLAALESKAEIGVICSSDIEYAEIAPKIIESLEGKAIVVLAGYPKDIVADLKKAGLEHFIHMRSNVTDSLQGFQQKLGL